MSEEIKMQVADNLLIPISDGELISKVTNTENSFIVLTPTVWLASK